TGDRPADDERPGICVALRGEVRRTPVVNTSRFLGREQPRNDGKEGTVGDRPEAGPPIEYFYGQEGTVTILVSKVTAPLRASARPFSVAPVLRVTSVSARMLPLKVELVPSTAELPTCQKMLRDWAAPARTTELLPAVVS